MHMGVSGPSLLIETTDSMIVNFAETKYRNFVCVAALTIDIL